jgi:drug/metabolite transporter (DMT)-like permease
VVESSRRLPAGLPSLDVALIAVAVAGISFSGPLIAATAAPALAIAFWRTGLAAAVTAPSAVFGRRARPAPLDRRTVSIALLAGVALALHFGTWIPSVRMTSVASATALVSTQSIFTALIAHMRGHRLPRLAWIGIALATAGATLVAGADIGLSGRALLGDLLAVLGGLFAAVYVTVGARARQELSTSVYTSICYAACALILLVVCLVGRLRLGGFSADAWLKILAVTVCAQLLGHSLINVALRTTSATVVSLAILLETPGAALVAAVWLHQRPPWLAVPGIVALFAGLVVVVRSRAGYQPTESFD